MVFIVEFQPLTILVDFNIQIYLNLKLTQICMFSDVFIFSKILDGRVIVRIRIRF